MADFKTALNALSTGKIKRDRFFKRLDQLLKKDPTSGETLLAQMRHAYEAGEIDAQTYAEIKHRIDEILDIEPEEGVSEPTEYVAEGGDSTVMLTEAEREQIANEDRTSLEETGGMGGPGLDFDISSLEPASSTEGFANTGTGATGTGFTAPATADGGIRITVGSMLKERFILDGELGKGGMGTVFRGRDMIKVEAEDRNPYVALKVLNEDFSQHPDSFIALQREASRQQRLAHPNIATVYDFDRVGATCFLVMELMEGEPLNDFIKKTVKKSGGLSFEQAFEMVRQLGEGLAYAHDRKLVHSDFKPGNCFRLEDGNMKVLDFGIARAVKDPGADGGDATVTKFDPGKLGALTPAYASLEMLEGEVPTPQDDIYALAIVAYELLTGEHPFNKKRATDCKRKGVVPNPIKKLTRRQMKGLARGLAYDREDRSETVEQFLKEFEGKVKPWQDPKIVGGAIAASLIAVGAPTLNWYLEQQKRQAVVDCFGSSNVDTIIAKCRPDLEGFKPGVQFEIKQSISDAMLEKFGTVIYAKADQDEFSSARNLLEQELKPLLSDSGLASPIENELDTRFANRQSDLNQQYNQALENALLTEADEGYVGAVLTAMRQVDPDNAILTDPRLAEAYVEEANNASDALDFDRAGAIIDTGLALIGDKPGLQNAKFLVDKAQQDAEEAAEIEALLAQIEPAVTDLTDLEALYPVSAAVARLTRLAPDMPMVLTLREQVPALLDTRIREIRASQQWGKLDTVENGLGDAVAALGLRGEFRAVAQERQQFLQRLDTLLAQFNEAIQGGQLGSGGATDVLAELNTLARDNVRVQGARDQLSRAYLAQAQQARATGDVDTASSELGIARSVEPGNRVTALLDAEAERINLAQRDVTADEAAQLERDRVAQADAFKQEFNQAFDSDGATLENAAQLLASLDSVQALAPGDEFVSAGRTRVADGLAEQARALSTEGDWQSSIDTTREALALVPESSSLQSTLEELQAGAAEALARAEQLAIEASQKQIDELLTAPSFDRDWKIKLQDELLALGEMMPEGDPWLVDAKSRIAEAYVGRAAQLREDQRFAEASSRLDEAASFDPLSTAVGAEREELALAEQAFEQERQEELKQARIDALVETVKTQAEVNKVRQAREAFEELRDLAPSNPFVSVEGPGVMEKAYVAVANEFLERDNVNQALANAVDGLQVVPNSAELRSIESQIINDTSSVVTAFLDDVDAPLTSDVANSLRLLETAAKARFENLKPEWTAKAKSQLQPLEDADQIEEYNQRLDVLQQAFPRVQGIQEITKLSAIGPAPAVTGVVGSLIAQGQLKQAADEIKQASSGDRNHPEFKAMMARYDERVGEAKSLYNQGVAAYKAADKKNEAELNAAYDIAKQAREVYADSDGINKLNKAIERALAKLSGTAAEGPPPPGTACEARLAGYGSKKQGLCFDFVAAKARGPLMVVVPEGDGLQPYAISKYEVTVRDYNNFCAKSDTCSPITGRDAGLPVTGISLEQAENYIAWLNERTGGEFNYRLPSDTEWAHAAAAGGKQPRKDWNCYLEQSGNVLKGQALVRVNTGRPNGWGLFNYVGNAAEWVRDGDGVKVRGGGFTDAYKECEITLEKADGGSGDDATGFRVARDLG